MLLQPALKSALQWAPLCHLQAGEYEAWVSPGAGGRLCRLVWHGPNGDRELVVPVQETGSLAPDLWPKQGAFPMLPYTNRLRDARFMWAGQAHRVRAVPGQVHGLHGMGHRQPWQIATQTADRLEMHWRHTGDSLEWPWSFSARLRYALSGEGLQVLIEVQNNASVPMPAVLGWHPYVPRQWLQENQATGSAAAGHDLGPDGLRFPPSSSAGKPAMPVCIDLQQPHTQALEQAGAVWTLGGEGGERWCLSSDAAHLVHHVPQDLAYACVEPVTALPGRLNAQACDRLASDIALAPLQHRRLNCTLSAHA